MLRLQNTPQCWKLLLWKINFRFFTLRRPLSWILRGAQILLRIRFGGSGMHIAGRAQFARKSEHRSFSTFKYLANPQRRICLFMRASFPAWEGYFLGACLKKGRMACCSYSRWSPQSRSGSASSKCQCIPAEGGVRPLLCLTGYPLQLIYWFYFRPIVLEGAFA